MTSILVLHLTLPSPSRHLWASPQLLINRCFLVRLGRRPLNALIPRSLEARLAPPRSFADGETPLSIAGYGSWPQVVPSEITSMSFHADVEKRCRQHDGGKKETKIECLWVGCRRPELLNEENLGRNICQSAKAGHLLSLNSDSEGGELGVLGSNCELCGRSFPRRDAMLRHLRKNCDSL